MNFGYGKENLVLDVPLLLVVAVLVYDLLPLPFHTPPRVFKSLILI